MATTSTTAFHRLRPAEPAGEAARTLDRIVETAEQINGLRIDDVQPGDWVVVKTRNSTYSLAAIGDGLFRASGGWFAAQGGPEDGCDVRIAGCTWGGAVIHTRLIAAVGMFLEFDNGVRTTRIKDVRLIRGGDSRTH